MAQDIFKQQARAWLERAIVIDVETTGLGERDTVVELAAVHADTRRVLIDSLIIPGSPMGEAAQVVHGISETEALEQGKPISWAVNELAAKAHEAGEGFLVLAAYNAPFDLRLVSQSLYQEANPSAATETAKRVWFDVRGGSSDDFMRFGKPVCIMELAHRYFVSQLEWDSQRSNFKRLSLEKCLKLAGIEREGDAHRALSDALAAVDLLRFMAGR